MKNQLLKTLKKYFGYDEFRPMQAEIINSVLAGQDNFVLMPTGGGKSLCYQLPALMLPGLTLVISPLIALMKDQVDALQVNGIKAEFINSSLTPKQIAAAYDRAKNREIKILYLAPERFAQIEFQSFLQSLEVSLIAVDEAHCISEWGHDFRPDYRNLSLLKRLFPGTPLIALTATATTKVREDIINQLKLSQALFFITSFNRENLQLSVIEKKQAFPKLLSLLEKYKNESVIIYCFSRKETEELAEKLRSNNFSAQAYHAGLKTRDRKSVQELFIKDKVDIIVATIAFGMGIDKPDVRLVVHYTYPKTLEGYYQEIGRAGRDGLVSECVTFYTYADTRKHEFFINQIEDEQLRRRAREKLSEILNFYSLVSCRKKYLLKYFGETLLSENCGSCDICLTKRETFDATIVAKKIFSAVARTENRFGRNYIIDILLGKKNQKILANKHEQLSVFKIITDFSESQLIKIINQLTDLNYLRRSEGQYPILSLTKQAVDFLRSNEILTLAKPPAEAVLSKKPTKSGELEFNFELFAVLKSLRRELAEQANVPPFVIFGDASLREMAHYFPQDKHNFLKISGVGAKKLEQFGDIFLKAIIEFTTKHKLVALIKPESVLVKSVLKPDVLAPKSYLKTKALIAKNVSIERIAKRQGLAPSTIVTQIEKMVLAGERINLEYLKLPRQRYETIKKAFIKCGSEKLKPVFEYLDKKYSYNELKIVKILINLP
ncbi:MAG: DNA helicase RecQ [Candidatus Buchananbacteria bacterium]